MSNVYSKALYLSDNREIIFNFDLKDLSDICMDLQSSTWNSRHKFDTYDISIIFHTFVICECY